MVSALFSYLPLLWSWSPDFAQGNEIVVKRRILFHLACWKKLIWMCSRERELLRLDETCIPSLVKRRFLGKLKGRRWLQRWEPCILSLVKKDFTGIAQGKEITVKSILLFPFARFCLSYMLYIIPRFFIAEKQRGYFLHQNFGKISPYFLKEKRGNIFLKKYILGHG